jgi:hypothetical protein
LVQKKQEQMPKKAIREKQGICPIPQKNKSPRCKSGAFPNN